MFAYAVYFYYIHLEMVNGLREIGLVGVVVLYNTAKVRLFIPPNIYCKKSPPLLINDMIDYSRGRIKTN